MRRAARAAGSALCRHLRVLSAALRARLLVLLSLERTGARAAALAQSAAAAEERLKAYHERERVLQNTLEQTERTAAALMEAAGAAAGDTVRGARAAADEILNQAQDGAAASLAAARAAGEQMLRAAQAWSEATVEAARDRARRDVEAILAEAGARIDPLNAAADRVAADIARMVDDLEQRVSAAGSELAAKVDAFEAQRAGYLRDVTELLDRHAITIERVAELEADVQERLLPALARLGAGLRREETAQFQRPPAQTDIVPHSSSRPRAGAAAAGNGSAASPSSGEVVIDHVGSFREAAKLTRALSELKGIRAARLRRFASMTATIDISAHGPLSALDLEALAGFALVIVDATPARVVLRLGPRTHNAVRPP